MKNTRTAIRELSARYRDILKKCFLMNVLTVGMVFATSAGATSSLTNDDYTAIANQIKTTAYSDGSYETQFGTKSTTDGIDWNTQYGLYEYDLDSSGTYTATLNDGTTPTLDLTSTPFQFTDQNGNTTDLATHGTGLTAIDFEKAAATVSSTNGASTHSGNNLGTTTSVAQNQYGYYADKTGSGTPSLQTLTDTAPTLDDFTKTITLTGSQNNGNVTVTGDSDATIPQQSQYTFTIVKADSTTSGTISWSKTGSSYTITTAVDGDLDNPADMVAALEQAKSEFNAYTNDVSNYNAAKTTNTTNYGAATTNYTAVKTAYEADAATQSNIDTNYSNYASTYATADGNRTYATGQMAAAKSKFDTDAGNYNAEIANQGTIGYAVSEKATQAINTAIADGGAIDTAIDTALANGRDPYQTQSQVEAIAEAKANTAETNANTYTDGKISQEVTDRNTAIATAKGEANTYTDGRIAQEVTDRNTAIATAKGEANTYTDGKIAQEVTDRNAAIATAKGEANTYTDGKIAQEVTDRNAAIATAKGEANAYTDGKISQEVTDRNAAIATATTMTTGGKNYVAGSVINAIKSIDGYIGRIHGLIADADDTTTSTGKAYAGNLAVGTTVEDHLLALDAAIGDMRNFSTTNTYATATNVADNLSALDAQVVTNTTAIGDIRRDMVATQAANNARFDRVETKINKLEDKMEKGLAANNALAGLVPLGRAYRTQLSAAMGGYKDNQAVAIGAFHYLNRRTLFNAGGAYGGNSDISYKVGVTFGF